MISMLIKYMMGPLGRTLEAAYLNHGLQASLLLLAWMGVVYLGLRGVIRLRQLLRRWVEELLPAYDPESAATPQRLLLALEPRWQEAAARVHFMPTRHGLWIQRATPERLKAHAGFTAEGIEQLIRRIRGPQPATAARRPSPGAGRRHPAQRRQLMRS
jgi:hypothetical protein